MVLLVQNSDRLVLQLCKEFELLHRTRGGKLKRNHVASATVGAGNERFYLILHLIR